MCRVEDTLGFEDAVPIQVSHEEFYTDSSDYILGMLGSIKIECWCFTHAFFTLFTRKRSTGPAISPWAALL